MTPIPERLAVAAARTRGWRGGNVGEACAGLALSRLGLQPRDVSEQFKVGLYRLDFAIPEDHIDIEIDGWVHTAANVRRADRVRDRALMNWGWTVVRISTEASEEESMALLTKATASLRARIGAHALHASHDSREITAKGRASFLASFEAKVDPDGILNPEERARRAGHLRKAHFTRLAYLSAKARAQ